MNIDKNSVKKILFITLSNLGDIILTTPVFNELLKEFPEAEIDIITGKPGEEIFSLHPSVRNIMFHVKHKTLFQRISQAFELRRSKYNLVVDLKNSILPYVLGAKYRTSLFQPFKKKYFYNKKLSSHKVNEHLYKLVTFGGNPFKGCTFFVPFIPGDEDIANTLIGGENDKCRNVIINPGAKSHLKRWPADKFAELSDRLAGELNCNIYITGNKDDDEVVEALISKVQNPVVNFCGRTSLGVLAILMSKSDLVITNDSAPLHLASSVNSPTIAIFGPTDEKKYGPLSEKRKVVNPNKKCRPCEKALCSIGPDEGCIVEVSVEEVFDAAKELLG